MVKHFCELYGDRFRYLFEPCPGKSYALNAGIRGARGSIVVFMDDDVTVEPTWLEESDERPALRPVGRCGWARLTALEYAPSKVAPKRPEGFSSARGI